MKIYLSIIFILICASFGFGQKIPTFADYPSGAIYKGRSAPAKITAKDRMFRTRLVQASRNQKANFAGHYILTFWGCGSSCVQGSAIDAKTGTIYDWGFSTASSDAEEIIRYKPNSSLIIFHGARDEKEGDDGDHYYKFDGRKFINIKNVFSK